MKWDRKNENEVYGCVFVKDYSIHSLRALNSSHIELLETIENKTFEILEQQFHLKKNEIVTFVHYVPSFWILHIHFCTIYSPLFKTMNCVIGRAIPLLDVIQNLKLKDDYYQTVPLRVRLYNKHPLLKLFKENK